MIEPRDKLTDDAISAWVADTAERAAHEDPVYQPTIQAEIIPLACVWALANRRLEGRAHSCFQFTQDVAAHDEASELWRRRAVQAGDPSFILDSYSYRQELAVLDGADIFSPVKHDLVALTDGWPEDKETISSLEKSLVKALGHAAYNSTSGGQLLMLDPLGPGRHDPKAFMSLIGDNQAAFLDRIK